MSELSKKLLKKRASAFGLEAVQEDQADVTLIPTSHSHLNFKSPQETKIHNVYEEKKKGTFPIQEKYTNASSGITFSTYYSPPSTELDPLFICHHGAGSSAMTFCYLAKYLCEKSKHNVHPGIFVFDARGHGDSSTPKPPNYTLSAFVDDFSFVLHKFVSKNNIKNPLILVGHSLGGAVITDFVDRNAQCDLGIIGMVVIDIVEETAVLSLLSLSQFLKKIPRYFNTYSEAIQWHLSTHMLRNEESARVSVVDLLFPDDRNVKLEWKAKLSDMAPFWDTWFTNLSKKFIRCNLQKNQFAKLLILSSNDTLDKDLMIGQMQGKFQLVVFNNLSNAGHFLHEDIPSQIRISLEDFIRRQSMSASRKKDPNISSLWGGQVNC